MSLPERSGGCGTGARVDKLTFSRADSSGNRLRQGTGMKTPTLFCRQAFPTRENANRGLIRLCASLLLHDPMSQFSLDFNVQTL